MIIYFLRHGLAGERDQWQGDDAERPLTKKGKQHMKDSANTFAWLNIQPDLIITSPLVRALQTAEITAKELGLKKDALVVDSRLSPGFNKGMLLDIVKEHPDLGSLMLVGHEPDFSATISALVGGGEITLKKGGLARVDLDEQDSSKGALLWLLPPKVLVDLAG